MTTHITRSFDKSREHSWINNAIETSRHSVSIKRNGENSREVISPGHGQHKMDIRLIVIEYLESIVEDRFNDTNLPAGICDIATGVCTHQGWSVMIMFI